MFLKRFYFCKALVPLTSNMVKRVCRDCPVPNSNANCLVKLSNHLTDVHQLDYSQRRNWLQEAKLQPKVRMVICQTGKNQTSETSPSKPQKRNDASDYQLSTPRKGKTSVGMLIKGIRKARKRRKRCISRTAK